MPKPSRPFKDKRLRAAFAAVRKYLKAFGDE